MVGVHVVTFDKVATSQDRKKNGLHIKKRLKVKRLSFVHLKNEWKKQESKKK